MIKRDLAGLAGQRFDLAVVGGGIIGSGIARDAALRGLKVLLVEKEDFGYGTTSRSSRLIHGGLRYLRRLEFGLVRQDLRERELLLRLAPHLVRPLPFLIPVRRGDTWSRLTLGIGLRLYDILSFDRSLPGHRWLSRKKTLEMEPRVEMPELAGAYIYYDAQADLPERLCFENVLSAVQHGATALNHTKVTGLLRSGSDVRGAQLEDTLTGDRYQAEARLVLNAAGHWVDSVWEELGMGSRHLVRRTKGVHLVGPRLSENALVLFAKSDGRLFFVLPWNGLSLIGTTDTDYDGDLDSIAADARDAEYLITEARQAFPKLRVEDVHHAMAGLRPLAGSADAKASDVSRGHKLVDHAERDGIGGFASVVGGKITAYRAVAEEATDLACRKLGSKAKCVTAETPLPGAPRGGTRNEEQETRETGLSAEAVKHLKALYGSRAGEVTALVPMESRRGGQQLCAHCPDIVAQVWHAVKEEGALTVGDFLLRRSGVGLGACQGLDAVDTVAAEIGRLLGWSAEEQSRQSAAYRAQAALGQAFRAEGAKAKG